ncbi:MAG: hypothetical protein KGZ45_07815 [Clostridium sp.]|nr:hypothetical protein [Clostridium sp.]
MSIVFRRETVMTTLLDPRQDFAPVKHEIEFRYDPLTGRSTRLAHLGAIKPQPLNYSALDGASKEFCPFCPPNIDRVTSLFPQELVKGRLRLGAATLIANIAPYDVYSGLVILSDKHILSMPELTADVLCDTFSLAINFLTTIHQNDKSIPYFFIGWNYMPPSGGGLVHPHIQVFGSKNPGNIFMDCLHNTHRYKTENNSLYWPDYLAEETKLGKRFLGKVGDIYWLIPFAPLGVLGDVLGVGPHNCTPQELQGSLLADFTDGLVRLFSYYKDNGIFSFNASICFSPAGDDEFPLLIRFSPRTFLNTKYFPPDTNFFQVMMQQPVCVIRPEELAAEIRPFYLE